MSVRVLLSELETARQSLDRAVACLVPVPKILDNEPQISPKTALRTPTIKFVTENGFAIERLCEREASTTDSASGCHFVVRGRDDEERLITVAFSEAAILLVQRQLSMSSPLSSAFWLRCAERQLATYLWEKNNFPAAGRLTVELSDENLLPEI